MSKQKLDARFEKVEVQLKAAGIWAYRRQGPDGGTISGNLGNGDTFTVNLHIEQDGGVVGNITHSRKRGRITVYPEAVFQSGLRRIITLHTGEPFSDQDRFDFAAKVPEVACLRLVLVETIGEGLDLISLRHGVIIATGYEFSVPTGIPCVRIGEREEREARELAGLPTGDGSQGWPGWDVILPWLQARFP